MNKKRNKTRRWRVEGSSPKVGDVYSKEAMRADRSRTWSSRAEKIAEEMFDVYAVFIFKWIAFSCLYDSLSDEKHKEKVERFVFWCWDNDTENLLAEAMQNNIEIFASLIKKMSSEKNKEKRAQKIRKQIKNGKTKEALLAVISQLYLLRNEIIHGQETWDTGRRKPAIRNASKTLDILLPIFAEILDKQ